MTPLALIFLAGSLRRRFFSPGTYNFAIADYYFQGPDNYVSGSGTATLVISGSPSAPAPVAGGGLLAAMAALIALGLRPLLRWRAGALA